MDERKGVFFYPNVCHVCKEFPRNYELKRCSGCKMIYYCTNAHQKLHWPQHKELCKAIRDVFSDKKVVQSSNVLNTCDRKTWVERQMNLMLLVGIRLKRKLQPFEEEMFKFPRVCSVCFDDNPRHLEDCQYCPGASFCSLHKDNDVHRGLCSLLRLSFDLDIAGNQHEMPVPQNTDQRSEYAIMELTQDRSRNISQELLGEDLQDFPPFGEDLHNRSINSAVNNKDLPITEKAELAHITEVYSRPFCIFYTILHLKYRVKCNMIIHVVGANMIEMANLEVWEMLLHTLPTIMSLKIILIGPELPCHNTINLSVCQNCILLKRKVQIKMYNTLYKSYECREFFEKPNIIVAYNAGLHECKNPNSGVETWAESLHSIFQQRCPFVVTSYTSEEAQKNKDRIKIVIGDNVDPIFSGVCPYASVRPYRDFETGGVYYQNQYITIYNELNV